MICEICRQAHPDRAMTRIPHLGQLCERDTLFAFTHYLVRTELAERRRRRLAREYAGCVRFNVPQESPLA